MRRFVVQKQALRQQARLRARQARAKVREEQAGKERRLARWGEAVAVALAERDEAVAECEQRAGRALRSLIEEGGLKTQEALAWCGSETLTGREIHRLIRGVVDADGDHLNQGEPLRPDSGDAAVCPVALGAPVRTDPATRRRRDERA